MHSTRNPEFQTKEISFNDILNIGSQYKKWIAAGGILTGVLAAMFAWNRPTQWQGSILLEMGQLDQKTDEVMIQSLNKVSLPVFKAEAFDKAKADLPSESIDKDRVLFQQTLRAENIKGTNFVEVKVNAFSKEAAQVLTMAVAQHLQGTLNEILLPAVELLKARYELNLKDLQAVNSDIQNLKRKLEKSERQTGSDLLFSNMILNDKIRESRIFEVRKLEIQSQLSPVRTFMTKVIEKANIYPVPGKPGPLLIVVMATLFGCLCVWSLAFVRNYWQLSSNSIIKRD